MRIRIIIYGLGLVFRSLYNVNGLLQDIQIAENIEIIGITDKEYDNNVGRYEYKLVAVDQINKLEYDYICVSSSKYFEEIKQDLIKINIPIKKLIKLTHILFDFFVKRIDYSFEGNGVDIGGPSVIFEEIYDTAACIDIVNFSYSTTWSELGECHIYKGKTRGKIIVNDATDLKDIENEKYDFVLSSNNLEHIANPLKAVKEWVRILKPNGILMIVVPAKDYCFDHNRDVVGFEHLLLDYDNDIDETDLSHIDEILERHDLSMDREAGDFSRFKDRCLNNYNNRCLHHHVYDGEVLKKIMEYFNLEEMITNVVYGGNHIIVAKKPE